MNQSYQDKFRNILGIKETLQDGRVNPNLPEFFLHTDYHTKKNEPWCAASMCWALETSGYSSPHSASAHAFVGYGTKCELMPGAIIVLEHLTGSLAGHFHVTSIDHVVNDYTLACLGGNQNDSVCVENFDIKTKNKVVWCSQPVKLAL